DPTTGNDTWDANCACIGLPLDCEGVPGGPDVPGQPCDDGLANTINDTYQPDCSCAGTPASFNAGNIVVLQAGDGSGALTNTGNPIVLREFTSTGTNTVDIPVPSSGSTPLVVSGTATTEGLLSRSADKTKLVFAGYAQALPGASNLTSSTAAAVNRAIGTADNTASFVREATSASAFSGGSIRGATSQGTDFWSVGANTGTVYFGPGAPATVSTTVTNNRAMEVHNGQLYFSTGSGTNRGVWAVGTGLPTGSGNTSAVVVNTGSAASSYEFSFNPATTICYIADDRTFATGGGVQRWDLISSVWTLSYTLAVNGTTGARGLEVDFSGGDPVLYATTTDNPNRLVRIVDTGAGSIGSTIATAPANTAFRGVAFAPETPCVADTDGDGICDDDDDCPLAVSGIANFDEGACACSLGYFATITDMDGNDVITACTICPPGTYCPDGIDSFPCDAGYFSSLSGQEACTPCPSGTFSDVQGSVACTACAPGFANALMAQTSCAACPPGSISSASGASNCSLCPANTYNPLSAQTECLACPNGETSGPGATECTPEQACTTDIDFVYQADGTDDLDWQLFEQNTNILVQTGGGALIGNGSEATCLP
ncbi:MAG: hypothetical protein WAT74_04345, partial [Flavobacteriales bacterium]